MSVKTLEEFAPIVARQGISGMSNGKHDVIAMRDTYNLMPILQKSAIQLAQLHIEQEFTYEEQAPAMEFLCKVALTSAMIFKGGSTKHQENCHLWAELLTDATNDPLKLRTYVLFSCMFTRTYMEMPLLIPSFGAVLDDCVNEQNIVHESLLAIVEALPEDARRYVAKSIQDVGGFKGDFDLSFVKKAVLGSVKDVINKQLKEPANDKA